MIRIVHLDPHSCTECGAKLLNVESRFLHHLFFCVECADRWVEGRNQAAFESHLATLEAQRAKEALIETHEAAEWPEGEVYMRCGCDALVPMFLLNKDGTRQACDGMNPVCTCEESEYTHDVRALCAVCRAGHIDYSYTAPLNSDGSNR